MATESSPEGKPLETTSFVVHVTRGLIRQQKVRRRLMLIILAVALLLVILGFTWLESLLDPRAHPGWFVFYWFVCAWLTGTAILLAVFDMLMLRTGVRRAERELAEQIERDSSRTGPNR